MTIISRVGVETISVDEVFDGHGAEGSTVSFDTVGHKITNHTNEIFQGKNTQEQQLNQFIFPSGKVLGDNTPAGFYSNVKTSLALFEASAADHKGSANTFERAAREIEYLYKNIDVMRSNMLAIQQG